MKEDVLVRPERGDDGLGELKEDVLVRPERGDDGLGVFLLMEGGAERGGGGLRFGDPTAGDTPVG